MNVVSINVLFSIGYQTGLPVRVERLTRGNQIDIVAHLPMEFRQEILVVCVTLAVKCRQTNMCYFQNPALSKNSAGFARLEPGGFKR